MSITAQQRLNGTINYALSGMSHKRHIRLAILEKLTGYSVKTSNDIPVDVLENVLNEHFPSWREFPPVPPEAFDNLIRDMAIKFNDYFLQNPPQQPIPLTPEERKAKRKAKRKRYLERQFLKRQAKRNAKQVKPITRRVFEP